MHFQWQTELDNLGFPNGDPGKEFKKIAIAKNATTGKEYVYTIALLNPEDKIIQFIPVTFKMK